MGKHSDSLGHIEYCDSCHRAKRIQFLVRTETTEFNLCSQSCLKDLVDSTLFYEDADWLKQEWTLKEEST